MGIQGRERAGRGQLFFWVSGGIAMQTTQEDLHYLQLSARCLGQFLRLLQADEIAISPAQPAKFGP